MKCFLLCVFLISGVFLASASKQRTTRTEDSINSNQITSSSTADTASSKNKRQTNELIISTPAHYIYRINDEYERAPSSVQEEPEDNHIPEASTPAKIRVTADLYRPGQVISINPRELIELQPERKSPSYDDAITLQNTFSPQPSRSLIARPVGQADVGEASVGAALSVSDSDTAQLDKELYALIEPNQRTVYGRPNIKAKTISYPKTIVKKQAVLGPSQIQRGKQHPQQYLIETTQPQVQSQPKRQAKPAQNLRYIAQPQYYEPENALKVVTAPVFQQSRVSRPFYRLPIDARSIRPDRLRSASDLRPVAYLRYQNQYPQPIPTPQYQQSSSANQYQQTSQANQYQQVSPASQYKQTSPASQYQQIQSRQHEQVQTNQYASPAQIVAEKYYIRPVYKPSPNGRYELAHLAIGSVDQSRTLEPSKSGSTNQDEVSSNQVYKQKSPSVSLEQNGVNLDEQRARLPPPRNNRAYTPEEFAALVAAGYSVTPIPVAPIEASRRLSYLPRHLPLRGDDAP